MNVLHRKISENLVAGPEGFMAARVHRALSHNTPLSNIFDGRIFLVPQLFPWDYEDTPKMLICPTLTGDPVEAPGFSEKREVEITIRIIYEVSEWGYVYDGPSPDRDFTQEVAMLADLIQYIYFQFKYPERELLENNKAMVSPGDTKFGPIAYDYAEVDMAEVGVITMFYLDLRITFTCKVDPKTGAIDNLALARA